jgi:hypothetical protein
MNVILYADNTLPINLQELADLYNSLCKAICFTVGKRRFRFTTTYVNADETYKALGSELLAELKDFDLAILATNAPYQNNYFFERRGNAVIVSFCGWNCLTDLSITNGITYFTTSLVLDWLEVGQSHDKNIGCINDFWWDKKGIDVGMRAAYICPSCTRRASKLDENGHRVLSDVQSLLNHVCVVSRANKDVLSAEPPRTEFDVFACHHSTDKPQVRDLCRRLKETGIRVWLDEEQLPPGRPWQPLLEEQIARVNSAVVMVGRSEIGPWQDMEIRAFLSEFVQRNCPVIPTILPDASELPELPLFLKGMTWVDLRTDFESEFAKLRWGILGKRQSNG